MSKYDEICTKLLPIENNLISKCKVTLSDVFGGLLLSNIWLRQGWGETKRRYRRTWLGPFWVTCTLLVFSVVLSVIWAKLWNQPFKEYLPFLLSGMIPWTFISGTINESCGTLISAESSIKSRQFPYSILFYGLIYRNLIVLAHNILVFALIIPFTVVKININLLLVIPGLVLVSLNLLWITIAVSIICLRYRDVQQLVNTFIQIIMFITPIFWPAEQLKSAKWIVDYNVLYHLIDIVRSPLLGNSPTYLSYLSSLILLVVGSAVTFLLYSQKRTKISYWF